MKSVITVLVFLVFVSISFSQTHVEQGGTNPPRQPQAEGEGWYKQNSGVTHSLHTIQFTSRDTGYVGGADGGLFFYRTTNGGNTWLPFGPPISGGKYFFFLNSKIAWVRGVEVLYYTENSGETWEERKAPIGKFKFFNKDIGWAVSGQDWGKTIDGGRTWRQLGPGYQNDGLHDLCIFDSEHMLGVGERYPTNVEGCASLVYDSVGVSRRVEGVCLETSLGAIDNLDSNTCITFGVSGLPNPGNPVAYRSKTLGFSWEEIPLTVSNASKLGEGVDFTDQKNGTAVGLSGAISRTRDGGYTWEEQNSTVDVRLNGVSFVDSLYGWACGVSGTILHTSDAGKTWVKQKLTIDSLNTQVHPSPVSTNLTVGYTLTIPQPVTIELLDLSGRTVSVSPSSSLEPQGVHFRMLPVSQLPIGAYWCRVKTPRYQSMIKFTIIR